MLSNSEATYFQPEHLLLTGSSEYKLKVFDGASTAWSKTITLILESNSDITLWTTDDHNFILSLIFPLVIIYDEKIFSCMILNLVKMNGSYDV